MGCACNKKREQFEVVRDGGAGRVVFRTGNQSTATTVAARYPHSIVRSLNTGTVVSPGTGSLELRAADGKVLFRTDDTKILAKAAAHHQGSTTHDAKTGEPVKIATAG